MSANRAPLARTDFLWLGAGALVLIGSGIGWRHPWPADEPGFVEVAREMAHHGSWLFPSMGGELYGDKPPLYFWVLAVFLRATGSIRWSFLLPSLGSAIAILWLVYDLARRLCTRREALACAMLLLCTVQFVLQTRSAQIDATLCLLTTLSLYGLLRHLLLGPAWGWYFASGLAAGLGVITKGVGFLPLLVLFPYALLRARGFEPLPRIRGGWRWSWAGVGLAIGIAVWVAPMLATVAATGKPDLVAYRHAILVRETAVRYFDAWQHRKPWYYFIAEVIPPLWLPLTALTPWLVPRWKRAWSARDARVWLPLAWALVVVVFFSLSTGKRGLYVFPALPAVALACAPALEEILSRRSVVRLGVGLAALLVLATGGFAVAYALGFGVIVRLAHSGGLQSSLRLASVPAACVVAAAAAYAWRPVLAWTGVLVGAALAFSWAIEPKMDPYRSGQAFMHRALAAVPQGMTLGLVDYKYQFLLYLERPVVDFGHRRWLDPLNEEHDAARWLDGAPYRVLLMPRSHLEPCFAHSPRQPLGASAGERWLLVGPPASLACAALGDPRRVLHFTPPPANR